ncbi:serine hydrolase [Mariprofundus erugo]|uniref:serine hydrolase n=1 Tax=Mariprofundus erugo TaxID=2528639 RepID=UPI0010FDEBF7|nr:serine hydrolase [Mariprofundus erugo]TLS76228.1 serine hydrolase [Mariprofundus erugo]
MNAKKKIRLPLLALTLFSLLMPYKSTAAQPGQQPIRSHASQPLQKLLDQRIKSLHLTQAVRQKHLAVVLVDMTEPLTPQLAQINGDEMMYAASLPKIAILLAAFERIQQGRLTLNDETRSMMTRMIRFSSNRDATAMIHLVGPEYINQLMQSDKYRLYDRQYNGGLWVGKEYADSEPFERDPLHNISHGATAIQVARFYYMLQTGKLVSPHYSTEMKRIMSKPGINHKFVMGLQAMEHPEINMFRKSGSWRDWHADSALIEHDGHRYIAVALAHDPNGGKWLKNIIHEMDQLIVHSAAPAADLARLATPMPSSPRQL